MDGCSRAQPTDRAGPTWVPGRLSRHLNLPRYARHMGEFVRLDVDGGVGTIRLDRPKMNALDAQVQRELMDAAEEADARTDVAAVVLYGGERVFAAGADVKEMVDMSFE